MSLARLLALGGGAAALGGAWWLSLPKDGEPPPPLPEASPPRSGGSGIPQSEPEIDALGRSIASEAGSGTPAEQKAIGWTIRNRFRGKSIYATQYPWRAQKGSNPPFSSARPATEATRRLASAILAADQAEDPTGGATSFFEPKMQDVFAKAGVLARAGETGDRVIDGVKLTDITRFKNYYKNAEALRASWSKGSALYATAGRFEFWGSARRASVPREIVGSAFDLIGSEFCS